MTYACTVAWCAFDGRSEAETRRHQRSVHPWIIAREVDARRCPVMGRDWAGRLMRCTRETHARGSHIGSLGGRIRRERGR